MMYIAWVIVAFMLTIMVHEWGHFYVARRAGVHVEVFAIGIGPRLVRLWRDRQGTDYILALLPLGGYVKMKGQEDLPVAVPTDPDPDSFQSKSARARLAIVCAGVVMNLVFAYALLVAAYSIGVPYMPNVTGGVSPGSPAAASGIRAGDEILAIGGRAVEAWEDVLMEGALASRGGTVNVTYARGGVVSNVAVRLGNLDLDQGFSVSDLGLKPYQGAVVADTVPAAWAAAGVQAGDRVESLRVDTETRTSLGGMLRLAADHPGADGVLLTRSGANGEKAAREIKFTLGSVIPATAWERESGFQTRAVVEPIPGLPADRAGLLPGDRVVTVGERSIRGYRDLQEALLRRGASARGEVTLEIERAGKRFDYRLQPVWDEAEERWIFGLMPVANGEGARTVSWIAAWMERVPGGLRAGDVLLQSPTPGRDGSVSYVVRRQGIKEKVTLAAADVPAVAQGELTGLKPMEKLIRYPWYEAVYRSVPRLGHELGETVRSLWRLVTGGLSFKAFGGPIMIVDTSIAVAKHKGLAYFLLLFVKIGISLAVVNILPLPVLDGGHAAFILYEMARGRPAPETLVRGMQLVGFFLLVGMFLVVTWNDLSRLGLF